MRTRQFLYLISASMNSHCPQSDFSVTKWLSLIDCSKKHQIYLSALWTELSSNLNCQVCPWSAHCLHGKRHHWGSDESIASCRRVGPTMDPHAHWNKHTHKNIHDIGPRSPSNSWFENKRIHNQQSSLFTLQNVVICDVTLYIFLLCLWGYTT